MKSVVVGTYYPPPFSTVTHLPPHLQLQTPRAHPSHLPKWTTNSKPSSSSPAACTVMNRRQALGNGFCLAWFHLLIHDDSAAAAEEAGDAVACDFTLAPSGLAYCDKAVGTGPQATTGQLIKAHYVGRLEDGKVFDSSYNRGKPLTFRVGVGEVIKGWDEGIVGGDGIPPMLVGGKRKLRIPPQLGYGIRGAGCRGGSCIIPPDSVLLFDVEFVGNVAAGGGGGGGR